jgi:biotin transport system substrate-specific component
MTADPRPTSSPRRRRLPARDLALVSTFAALIAVLGLPGAIAIPGNPVPITLQTMGVMLAGSVLGARRGALAVLTFLALVAAGLPLLSGGRGGLGVFVGPSAGYLVGFVVGAFVIGWLVQRRLPRYPLWWGGLANVVGGIVVVYAIGIPVTALVTGTSGLVATAAAAVAFLPGDVLKVVLATAVAAAVHRAVPEVAPVRRRERERAAA